MTNIKKNQKSKENMRKIRNFKLWYSIFLCVEEEFIFLWEGKIRKFFLKPKIFFEEGEQLDAKFSNDFQ